MTIKPTVMCFSGLDPSGGAGIQADIETVFSLDCHCAPVITVLTAQNTENALSMAPVEAPVIAQQARAVLEDSEVSCFKIGLLTSVEVIETIHALLNDYGSIPVVLDPILSAGGGFKFNGEEVREAMTQLLLPLTTVLTPNTEEIKKLAPSADSVEACAQALLESGTQHVLLTGTHAESPGVENRLFSQQLEATVYNWPRLEASYHGSGCTLAAAIAAKLALGLDMRDAAQQAQRFTWEALNHGYRSGIGQHTPNRSFWKQQKHSA